MIIFYHNFSGKSWQQIVYVYVCVETILTTI